MQEPNTPSPSLLKKIGFPMLLLAGGVIVALCYYKVSRTYQPVDIEQVRPAFKKNAPLFVLYDYHKPQELVRLETYIGRHRILLVFFDSKKGAFDDPTLMQLYRSIPQLKKTRTIVIAVSDALPQTNRKLIEQHQQQDPTFEYPFPLLSDPGFNVYRAYGRYHEQTEKLLTGLFVIDRSGQVEWMQTAPKTSSSTPDAIQKLLNNPDNR